MTSLIRYFACLFVATMAGSLTVQADTREVYTISGIEVDVLAENAQLAQQQAFSQAKQVGLRRLVDKLTLAEDRTNALPLNINAQAAEALTAAVDVIEEKRTATVYRGTLAVVYNPVRVRSFLEAHKLAFVEVQADTELMVPVARDTAMADVWARNWPQKNTGSLVPYETTLALYGPNSDWLALSQEANVVGTRSAVIAELIQNENSFRVRLTRVTPAGREYLGITNNVVDLKTARRAASAYLDTIHKSRTVIRSDERSKRTATVLYSDVREWNNLRSALARTALVSDFKVDAVARDGALVTFLYAGDVQRLREELRRRGVLVEPDPEGWIMRPVFAGAE